MDRTEYLDFDLMIERTGDNTYRARVLASPAGQASKDVTMPYSGMELENFLLRIGRPRRGVRRLESPEMENAKIFGGKLFKSVFEDDILSALRSSLDEAQKQNQGLRIRLRLNDAPELVNLPWEYLYNPSLNRFFSLSVNTPLVRYLEMPERIVPLAVKPPLRVLVMISSPSDHPTLDVEREWNNLKSALSGLEERGLLVVERLDSASPVALQYALRRDEFHIFHFIGHGGFNEQAQDGILLFEDENRRGRPLSGQYLGTILHDEQTMRLVVLNACEGGRSGSSDPFAGVAQSLVQQGLPAVIAMQFEITDEAAIAFAREFYTAIAEGFPVDAAMSEARKAIFSLGNDIEWGTPVLYMRAPDGQIFDVSKAARTRAMQKQAIVKEAALKKTPSPSQAKTKEPEIDLEGLYVDGLSAYWLQDWAKAHECFQQINDVNPTFKDVITKLAEVDKQLTITTLNTDASQAVTSGNWAAGVEALEKLSQYLPEDKDVTTRLEQAKTADKLAALYAQAKQLSQAKQWQAVTKVFCQIHDIQPNYGDPDDLLDNAQHEVALSERHEKLKALYKQALQAMETDRWQEAAGLLDQVKTLDANYRDTAKHMERVRIKLEAEQIELAVSAQTATIPDEPVQPLPIEQPAEMLPAVASKPGRPRWLMFAIGGAVLVGVILIAVIFQNSGLFSPAATEALPEPTQADVIVQEPNPESTEIVAVIEQGFEDSTPTEPAIEVAATEAPAAIEEPSLSDNLTGNQLITVDYFKDDFSSNSLGWYEEQSDEIFVSVQDDGYVFQINIPNWYVTSNVPIFDFQPVFIEFDVITPFPGGSYGVYCNYTDQNNYYEIRLETTAPNYSIWQVIDGNENALLPDEYIRTATLRFGPDAYNNIKIYCEPGLIILTINENEEPRISYDESSLDPGYFVLVMDSWDELGSDGFRVVFDYLYVSK